MKKLLLTVTAIIAFGNISAYACSCSSPNYNEVDKVQAAENFLKNKLNVDEMSILKIEQVGEGKNFSKIGSKLLNSIVGVFTSEVEFRCEKYCSKIANEVVTFNVEYIKNKRVCTIELEVKMLSNIFSNGFKSSVKNTAAPNCD